MSDTGTQVHLEKILVNFQIRTHPYETFLKFSLWPIFNSQQLKALKVIFDVSQAQDWSRINNLSHFKKNILSSSYNRHGKKKEYSGHVQNAIYRTGFLTTKLADTWNNSTIFVLKVNAFFLYAYKHFPDLTYTNPLVLLDHSVEVEIFNPVFCIPVKTNYAPATKVNQIKIVRHIQYNCQFCVSKAQHLHLSS